MCSSRVDGGIMVMLVLALRTPSVFQHLHRRSPPARAAMALATLSGDEQCIIFVQLCNTLDPGIAVAFGSINSELWALTPALLQQLRADYEVATACLLYTSDAADE